MVDTTAETLPDLSARTVLVLDDDTSIVRAMGRVFRALGARAHGVGTLREARLALEGGEAGGAPDAVLADLHLREGDEAGLELLPEYLARRGDGAYYLMTGHGSVAGAVEALRRGARHYFEKPVEPIALARQVARDLEGPEPASRLARRLAPWLAFADPATARALAAVPGIAEGNEPVVIEGEDGTGRSLVARAIHGLGDRAAGPLVAVDALDAGADPFGQGAASGRRGAARSAAERADGGTLLVREPAELDPEAQVALVRLLDTATVRSGGAGRTRRVDVRTIAIARRPLDESVAAGALREDLRYRLDVLHVRLPPLRARPADVHPLATRALARAWRERGRDGLAPTLEPDAVRRLAALPWHGNVRELGNAMRRLSVALPDGVREVDAALLGPALDAGAPARGEGLFVPRGTTLAEAEWLLIDSALRETGCNRAQAARLLGMGERTLRRKLNER